MTNVMKDLHRDHRNFGKVLAMLTEKLAILKGGEKTPNFALMLDAVDYLEKYANLYHHPKEDIVYSFHLKHSNVARDTIDMLMREHQDLKSITVQLRQAIDGVLHGDILLKDRFIEQLAVFIKQQQNHLDTEEASIFPLLEKDLNADDWERIEKIMPTRNDPLFGDRLEKQYATLYERIA